MRQNFLSEVAAPDTSRVRVIPLDSLAAERYMTPPAARTERVSREVWECFRNETRVSVS